MRLIDADELITAFPCGESVRTESVRATINHMPTIEVSEDAISREWAINKQKELIELYTPHKTVEGRGQVYWQIEERKLVAKELEQAPSVIPKPKEGEWMPRHHQGVDKLICECSNCHTLHVITNFCPNCGADMRGGKDD